MDKDDRGASTTTAGLWDNEGKICGGNVLAGASACEEHGSHHPAGKKGGRLAASQMVGCEGTWSL